MMDFSTFYEKFPSFSAENLCEVLSYLKNNPEYDFDMLTSIIATDLQDKIELMYVLYSTKQNELLKFKIQVINKAPSVIEVYKSAYFDECEIYDLFGIKFIGNKDLKRLLMPENWIGHPLLKSYKMNDERLAWNE